MNLKSLVSIEIDTGRSQQGSTQIVDSLNKINKTADATKKSVSSNNEATKKYFDDFAKDSKQTAATASTSANKLTNSYEKSTQSIKTFESAAKNAKAANDSFFTSSKTNILAFTAAIAGATYALKKAVGGVIEYSDAWTNINNSLTQVADSEENLLDVRKKVLVVSKDTFSNLKGTADLYSGLARSTSTLGISQDRLVGVTKTINNLFLSGGKAASETAGAITQLNQGLAAGALRGDEFNSVAEGAPKIMDALAASLHMGRAELRDFAATGGITSEILVNALESYSAEAKRMVDITQRTFGQNSELAKTYLTEYVGNMEAFQKITQEAGNILVFFASNLDSVSQVVQALAAGVGVGLVVAFGKYAFALAATAKEQLFLNTATTKTISSLGVVTVRAGTATIATNALAIGSRALSASMALLGGPIGVITLAASALIYFSMQADAAEEDMNKLKSAGENAADEFKKFGEAQKTQALVTLREELDKSNISLKMMTDRLEETKKASQNGLYNRSIEDSERYSKSILRQSAELERAKQKTDDLQKSFDKLNKIKFYEVEKQIVGIKKHFADIVDLNNLGLSKIGVGVLKQFSIIKNGLQNQKNETKKVSEEYTKQEALIKKQIDLINNKSKAVELAYDIEHGLVKGIEGDEAKRLINLLKTLEAVESLKEKQDDLMQQMKDDPDPFAEYPEKLSKAQKELQKYNAQLIKDQKTRDTELAKIAKENSEKMLEPWIAATERLDESFANAWGGAFDNFESFKDQFINSIKQMAGEVIHQFTTKKFTDAVSSFLMLQYGNQGAGMGSVSQNIGSTTQGYTGAAYAQWSQSQQASGGSSGGGAGSLLGAAGAGGLFAIGAVVAVAAVNAWNKKQDEKFVKMTAEYRQGVQSTGTILGDANKKSESIANAIKELGDLSSDVLNVNYDMYRALLSIDSGINGVASGFSRQFGISGGAANFSNINTGTTTPGPGNILKKVTNTLFFDDLGGEFLAGFANGITDAISKNIYRVSKKIIDSGIQFIGGSLADILVDGTIGAFAYADIKTTKKFLGVTTSSKVKTQTQELNEILLAQFANVFEGAGDALRIASDVFSLDFDKYIDKLVIDPQKLSLKDLEGDALTKEIESFFSSTLDNWAGVLVGGTDILLNFQRVGEGAFETVIRLASQLNTFNGAVDLLGLNFSKTGFDAVEASQNFIELSGGIDKFQQKTQNFYNNFFSEQDKLDVLTKQLKESLEEVGVPIPATRELLKQYVQSLDLANEADAERANRIFDLSNYLNIYYKDIEDKEKEALEQQLKLEEEAYKTRVSLTEKFVDEFNSEIETFNKSIQEAADAAVKAHQAISDSLLAITKDLQTSIEYISGYQGKTVEELLANVGIGSLDEQIENINQLNTAIIKRYDNELSLIENLRSEAQSAYDDQVKEARKAWDDQADAARKAYDLDLKNTEKLFDEKQKIEKDAYNDQVKNAKSAFDDYQDKQKEIAKNNLDYSKKMLEYSNKLLDAADALLLSDLSPLLNKDKLAVAEKQFKEAKGEDVVATAQEYLKQARDYYASSGQYTDIFNSVQSRLRSESKKALGSSSYNDASYQKDIAKIEANTFEQSDYFKNIVPFIEKQFEESDLFKNIKAFDESIYSEENFLKTITPFDGDRFDKQIEDLKNESLFLLDSIKPFLSDIQTKADEELEIIMSDLSKKTSEENERLLSELKIQTDALNLIPENLTKTNEALAKQLELANALLEEAKRQTKNSSEQSTKAQEQIEALQRRIQELTDAQNTGNKP
jgi:tape measure domain-containing protein